MNATDSIEAIAVAPNFQIYSLGAVAYVILPSRPSLSSTQFTFPQESLGDLNEETVTTVTNSSPRTRDISIALTGDASFTLQPAKSCGSKLAAGASCPIVVDYLPAVVGTHKASVGVTFTGVLPTSASVSLTGVALQAAPGTIAATGNPLVASYTVNPGGSAMVTVQFGTDTSYGFTTSAVPTSVPGGDAAIEVAGMKANTTYHMRAQIAYLDGSTVTNADQTFTTGTIPAGLIPSFTVSTTSGLTPQPGIELASILQGATPSIPFSIDLSGNVNWYYAFPDRQQGSILYPIKLLPNGHFMCLIAPASQTPTTSGPVPASTLNVLREFDLAGNTIRQLAMSDLNSRLASAGYDLDLQLFSHDFATLPNGHTLVIANMLKPYANVTGYPGTTNVLGDVVVDLDQNFNPVWVWNEFDHFDVNRHPYLFPDWTHSNAIAYSPDDGNFLISIRHQNWIVKVDYNNGLGAGDVLWKLGYQGDFALQGGTDPTDWFYAQHDMNFVSPNTTGDFELAIMDNGDDRVFPPGVVCGSAGAPPCLYTTIPLMQVDENAKTATLVSNQTLAPSLYSGFAGDTRVQPNGNVEFDLAGVGSDSYVFEVTPTQDPQTVWQMHVIGDNTYRDFRMPSLYPGVQW